MATNEEGFFAYQAEAVVTELAQVLQKAKDLVRIYDTRLYGPGADNAITGEDMAGFNQPVKGTPDDLYGAVIFFGQLTAAADASPYKSALDKLRQDY